MAEPPDTSWPGDFLLHPLAILAIVVLVANDWFGKARWPGDLTGKLSDVAGMVFFPLLLVALAELGARLFGRRWLAGPMTFLVVAVVVALVFAGTKTVEPVRAADELVIGWIRWVPHALVARASGDPTGPVIRPHVVADGTDLVAVPFVLAAVWVGTRYRPTARREPDGHGR